MRTMSRISVQQSTNSGYRFTNTVALLGVLSLAGAIATWRGSVLSVVVPLGLTLVGLFLFATARRALRRASARIDRILLEELDRDLH
jgi:hypothetical protein